MEDKLAIFFGTIGIEYKILHDFEDGEYTLQLHGNPDIVHNFQVRGDQLWLYIDANKQFRYLGKLSEPNKTMIRFERFIPMPPYQMIKREALEQIIKNILI